ncbi:MAG: electron transfer flavoprotein subunit alpha/FixB family protein [Acidimicrobiales bacterium]
MLLVVLEHDRGEIVEAALQALTFGRALADRMGAEMHAAVIGSDDAGLVTAAGAHGAVTVHVATHEILSDYGPEAHGETVAEMARELEPDTVIAGGSDRGNEVLAQAAARLDSAFVANCTGVTPGDPWEMTRLQWGGSLLEDVELTAEVALVTCAPHAVVAEPVDSPRDVVVEEFRVELDPVLARTVVRDRVVLTRGMTLPTAPVVVGGGRGVGSAEGFAALEELAGLLGGVVGCSRAVTNNGWRPHADQVGQTGTRIAPDIYIAAGISGAIQHWVGASGSKRILAINTDPEANMVAKAGYAVIGDLHEVIPAIVEEIRSRRA